jgi:DNA polymerase
VGRAGQLLGELLAEVGLAREEVFICNVLKCRPPGNRDPQPDEIDACKPYLYKQVELIEPRVVCTLGNFATKLLTRSSRGIMSCHGKPQEHELGGRRVRIYPLCHPAAALRTPATKEMLREDFARLPALLAEEPLEPPVASHQSPGEQVEAVVEPDQLGLFG